MRSLIIDSGNTIIKAAIFVDGDISIQNKEYFTELVELTDYIHSNIIDRAIFTDVGGNANGIINLLKFEDIPFIRCNYEIALPFKLDYQTPETLGDDRIAAVAAGQYHFPGGNVLILDAGTCITADIIDSNGIYQGGSISPGIKMRFESMNQMTSGLPLIHLEKGEEVQNPGKTTRDSMINGVINGALNEIQGFIDSYSNKYPDLHVLIGGGDKKFFESNLKGNIFARENLILEGLISILSFHDSH